MAYVPRARIGDQGPHGAFRQFLRELPADLERHGPFEMVFAKEPAEETRRLLEAIGVEVRVEPGASVEVRQVA